MKETELATAVMEWLEEQWWDCYPEAQFRSYGGRADIAAVRDGRLWIVECKCSLSMALLNQAHDWTGAAHYVSVAAPSKKRRGQYGGVVDFFLREKGMGHIKITEGWDGTLAPYEILPPRLHRYAHHRAKELIGLLHPDMKRYKPGNANSDFSSPFNRTMRAVVDYIKWHPGCTQKDIVDNVPHHYGCSATARSCIPKWLAWEPDKYRVRTEQEGRMLRFYPADKEEAG